MINFLEEHLRVESSNSERRCCCTNFHHGFFAQNHMHLMLRNRVVELIFQPPYSPEFNSCEFCFMSMKAHLRQHETVFTELVIIQGLQTITPAIHCGFVI